MKINLQFEIGVRMMLSQFIKENRISFDMNHVKNNGYSMDDERARKYRRYGIFISKDAKRILVYLSFPIGQRPTPDEVLSVLALDFYYTHSLNHASPTDKDVPPKGIASPSRREDGMKKNESWLSRRKRAEEIKRFFGEAACRQLLDTARELIKAPHSLLTET
jgi:hypothetical protein